MFRKSLPFDRGMLFVFHRENFRTMWMKNTYIPLDILFIDSLGRVQHFVENTKPLSLETIFSQKKAKFVLELAAGSIKRNKIQINDQIFHKEITG